MSYDIANRKQTWKKQFELDVVAHTWIRGTQKVVAGKLWLWGFHGLYSELPPQIGYLEIAYHLKPKAQVKRRREKKQRGRVMCLNLGGVSGIDKG